MLYQLSYLGTSVDGLRHTADSTPGGANGHLLSAIISWSGKRDSNPRPRAWKARALPTELFPLSNIDLAIIHKDLAGGEGRIRTSEGISRQIYSLLPLATREPLRSEITRVPEPMGGFEPSTY